jgi:peptidoglycan/LPS O-acetylase OafA/YrhL
VIGSARLLIARRRPRQSQQESIGDWNHRRIADPMVFWGRTRSRDGGPAPSSQPERGETVSSLPAPSPSPGAFAAGRLPQLDALRGAAALVVVLHHILLTLSPDSAPAQWLAAKGALGPLALGRPAVVLFFVLSGFVLARSIQAVQTGWRTFALKRCARLLIPLWVALALSLLAHKIAPNAAISGVSLWFNEQWREPITFGEFGRNLLLLAGPRNYPLDHVAWSLVHEMRLSLLLPLILVIIARRGVALALALTLGLSCCATCYASLYPDSFALGAPVPYLFDSESIGASLIVTARFLVDFVIGAAISKKFDVLASLRQKLVLRVLAPLASLVLLWQSNELVMALGAAGLVVSIGCWNAMDGALHVAPIRWLGRVSYSLYLIHMPVLLTFAHCLAESTAPPIAVLLALAACMPLAELFHRCIESPAIRLSRSI